MPRIASSGGSLLLVTGEWDAPERMLESFRCAVCRSIGACVQARCDRLGVDALLLGSPTFDKRVNFPAESREVVLQDAPDHFTAQRYRNRVPKYYETR